MKRTLLLAVILLPFLSACGSPQPGTVYETKGRAMGEIRTENEMEFTIIDIYGQVKGRVRGELVRDESGGRAGTVVSADGIVSIRDPRGKEVGQLKKSSDCFGPEDTQLGTVRGTKDPRAAAGGCLLLLIQKELRS